MTRVDTATDRVLLTAPKDGRLKGVGRRGQDETPATQHSGEKTGLGNRNGTSLFLNVRVHSDVGGNGRGSWDNIIYS